MLFTIYNLPANARYQDVKNLLWTKCRLKDMILDKLLVEGSGKKVTIGLADAQDAVCLLREIDGLYLFGNKLFVEDLSKKKSTDGYGDQQMQDGFRNWEPALNKNAQSGFRSGANMGNQRQQNNGGPWDQDIGGNRHHQSDFGGSGGENRFGRGSDNFEGNKWRGSPPRVFNSRESGHWDNNRDKPTFDSFTSRYDGDRQRFEEDRPRFDHERSTFDCNKPTSVDDYRFDRERPFDGDRPRFDHERPTFDGSRPTFDSSRSTFDSTRPAFNGLRPTFVDDRRIFDRERPTYDVVRPKFDADIPRFENERPTFDSSRPSFMDDRRRFDPERPAFDADRPRFDDQRPILDYQKPSNDRSAGMFRRSPDRYGQNDRFAQNEFGRNQDQFRDIPKSGFGRENASMNPWQGGREPFDSSLGGNRNASFDNYMGHWGGTLETSRQQKRFDGWGRNDNNMPPPKRQRFEPAYNKPKQVHTVPARQPMPFNTKARPASKSREQENILNARTQGWINKIVAQITEETIKNINIHDEVDKKRTRQLKKVIRERVLEIFCVEESISLTTILAEYRRKYPNQTDHALFVEIVERDKKKMENTENTSVKLGQRYNETEQTKDNSVLNAGSEANAEKNSELNEADDNVKLNENAEINSEINQSEENANVEKNSEMKQSEGNANVEKNSELKESEENAELSDADWNDVESIDDKDLEEYC